jgi:hypothetical protein
VGEGALVSIEECAFRDFRNPGFGLALLNRGGVLTVRGSRFENNRYGIANGGLSATAILTVSDSDFVGNQTGVANWAGLPDDRVVQLADVRFSDNHLAIDNGGKMRLVRAQMDRNGRIYPDDRASSTIVNSGRLTILDTTIQDGRGHGIRNMVVGDPPREGVLSLIRVRIMGGADLLSGVYQDAGQVSIDSSLISGASRGVWQWGGTTLITSSVIADSYENGIEIWAPLDGTYTGSVTLRRSAVIRSGNMGINVWGGTMIIENSTVSGNGSRSQNPGSGGGISVAGRDANNASLTLLDSTVASNTGEGFKIYGGGHVTVRRSILVGNSRVECAGAGDPAGAELDDRFFTCDEAATLASLGLGPLTEMGGTFVHPILDPSSPLVDRVGTGCSGPDQAGTERPQLAGCDFGAFELPATTMSLDITPIPLVTITPTAAGPVFTFTQQANCRKGPNTLYESLGFGQVGEQVSIQGLSDPAGWYYVQLPAGTRCFAAGSTGDVSGLLDDLPVIPAPPLPVLATSTPPAPAAPSLSLNNQVCDATQYVVRMGWKDVEGETGYRVYRDGGLIATLAANATIYDDTSPDYNAHDYRVEAFNASGATSSATVSSEGCLY